jgi:signal transduction histidine kinase
MTLTLSVRHPRRITRLTGNGSAERTIPTSYFWWVLLRSGRRQLTPPPDIRRLSDVDTTATRQRPAAEVVAVAVGGLIVLLSLDLLLGLQLFDVVLPALAGDIAVIGALALALVSPPRTIAPAAVAGCAASVVISLIVHFADSAPPTTVIGVGAWPGFVEIAGLGLLTGWSVRSASRNGALISIVAFGLVMVSIAEWRNRGRHSDLLSVSCAATWAAVVAAGWYLRVLDARQIQQSKQVRHQERLAIARELHDVVAHHVTGIVVQAQAAQLIADQQPDAARRALDTIARAGGEAMAAMRAMVGALRDESASSELVPTASIDDLRAMAETAAPERGQLPVRLAIDDRSATLPDTVMASVHRIAREAVTNARRHSVGATNINIDVSCADGIVHLLVTNDGALVSRSPGGFGLRGMAERAAAMGGEFDAGPLPAGGWRVAADLPVAVGADVAPS